MSSLGNGITKDRAENLLTPTSSEAVNKSETVNSLLTVSKNNNNNCNSVTELKRFKQELQRVSLDHRLKAEKIAEKYGRKTFNDVLDVYVFCYDLCEKLCSKLHVPLSKLQAELDKLIPARDEEVIGYKVGNLMTELAIDAKTRKIIEPLLFYIVFTAKIKRDLGELDRLSKILLGGLR
ncbi:MAG: hypothetical protein QXV61_00055 [Archaeoglobaceae archaeon]